MGAGLIFPNADGGREWLDVSRSSFFAQQPPRRLDTRRGQPRRVQESHSGITRLPLSATAGSVRGLRRVRRTASNTFDAPTVHEMGTSASGGSC